MKALFVTGTDTGAGKTFAACALAAAWREEGLRVGVMKPCETGCAEGGDGTLHPADAAALRAAAGSDLPLEIVCPYRFRTPLAPAEAAEIEGRPPLSFDRIAETFHRIARRHDVTLVEGAGGLLVPFVGGRTAADLAACLGIPLLVTARIGLGTINHTGLTLEAARSRRLPVLGVIFTRTQDPALRPPGPDEARNPAAVARLFRVKVLGNIPWIPDKHPDAAAPHVDARAVLEALESV